MWCAPESDQFVDELYLAGERVSAGAYRQLGTGRVIGLEEGDRLPASVDGRVATYVIERTWSAHAVVRSEPSDPQRTGLGPVAYTDDSRPIHG